MPSNHLAEKIYEILRRAAPEQLHSLPEMVAKAQQRDLTDDEILNMLCHRYGVGRDGWPLDPVQRRRARVERFFENNCPPEEMNKAEMIIKQQDYTDEEIIDTLKKRYGRDEVGDPVDSEEKLREQLMHVFKRVAPEKIGKIHQLLEARKKNNWSHSDFFRMICDDHRVGRDGWPNDPIARRRARLTRFFLTNAPEELRKVEKLTHAECSEADVFRELFDRFGKDEFGDPVPSKVDIRHRLEEFFKVAAPDNSGASIESLLVYQTKRNLSDDELMLLVQRQFDAGPDGWPTDPTERLRARVTRFFVNNYPEDVNKIESLLNLKGVSEDEVMKHLRRRCTTNGPTGIDSAAAGGRSVSALRRALQGNQTQTQSTAHPSQTDLRPCRP